MTLVDDTLMAVNDFGTTSQNSALTIAASSLMANDLNTAGGALTITDYTQPGNGAVTFDGTDFIYTPTAGFNGSDQFTYTINSGTGGSSTATVFLTVTPLPVANDDWAYPASNSATPIYVLQNDTDSGGSNKLTIQSVSSASDGVVSIGGGGAWVVYTSSANYQGTDSFTYTISDGHGHTSTATVHLIVTTGSEWASSVLGESSEWTDSGPYDWYAVQALGTPNTDTYGDNPTAWAPEPEGDGTAWLSLGFATAEKATGVIVRETDGNGFVTEIDLKDTSRHLAHHLDRHRFERARHSGGLPRNLRANIVLCEWRQNHCQHRS